MANISWTSSSINSFFNTSLGNPSSSFSGIYSSLSDASLIKRGVYHKLMDSYYSSLKDSNVTSSDKASSNKKTETTTEKKAPISNNVIDELLSEKNKKPTISNKVLDELLSDEKKDSASCTYDSTGAKTQTSESTIDQSI